MSMAHVLVIDDEPQILRALRTILQAKKFKVSVASRGEEGLTLAAAQPPDVIILDLSLPDMDGFEVCQRLREWTQVPIIILSVRDSERDKVMALDRGADDYLTKPFGIEELLARIRVALKHSAQAQGTKETIVVTGNDSLRLRTAHIRCEPLIRHIGETVSALDRTAAPAAGQDDLQEFRAIDGSVRPKRSVAVSRENALTFQIGDGAGVRRGRADVAECATCRKSGSEEREGETCGEGRILRK